MGAAPISKTLRAPPGRRNPVERGCGKVNGVPASQIGASVSPPPYLDTRNIYLQAQTRRSGQMVASAVRRRDQAEPVTLAPLEFALMPGSGVPLALFMNATTANALAASASTRGISTSKPSVEYGLING